MKSLLAILATLALSHFPFAADEASAPSVLPPLPSRIAYAEESSQKIRLKIMPLGDSITFGSPDPSYGGYRRLLGTLLTNDGYVFEFVGSRHGGNGVIPDPDNEGHPGFYYVLSTWNPYVVVLMKSRFKIERTRDQGL